MRYLFFLSLLYSLSFASFENIDTFEADFNQSVTDEKGKTINYSGHVIASKPQNAKWSYKKPILKDIYVTSYQITIVEPELEQAIKKRINSNFNLFNLLKNAKKIADNRYETYFKNAKFQITLKKGVINSISYIDEFDNSVKVVFSNQEINKKLSLKIFSPKIPIEYDVITN